MKHKVTKIDINMYKEKVMISMMYGGHVKL